MYNWSTDENLIKRDPKKYAIWKLEQMINFGLNGQKIPARDLKKYWPQLNIDPARRRFLEIILNEK